MRTHLELILRGSGSAKDHAPARDKPEFPPAKM